jgi:hypothetical protein
VVVPPTVDVEDRAASAAAAFASRASSRSSRRSSRIDARIDARTHCAKSTAKNRIPIASFALYRMPPASCWSAWGSGSQAPIGPWASSGYQFPPISVSWLMIVTPMNAWNGSESTISSTRKG